MTLMVKVELRAEHYKKIQKDCINWAINVRHAALERQLLHDRHPGRYEKLQPRGGWRLQRVRGTVTESWPNAYHDVSEKDSRYQRNLADTIFRRDWTCTCCYKSHRYCRTFMCICGIVPKQIWVFSPGTTGCTSSHICQWSSWIAVQCNGKTHEVPTRYTGDDGPDSMMHREDCFCSYL